MNHREFEIVRKATVLLARGFEQQVEKEMGPYPNDQLIAGTQMLTNLLTELSSTPDQLFFIPTKKEYEDNA